MKSRLFIALAALLGSGLVSCSRMEFSDAIPDAAYSEKGAFSADGGLGSQGRPGGEAGVLTAGEWNDLSHWDFWSRLMTSETFGSISSYWGFYTPRRVSVRVADAAGNRLPAIKVVLEQDQKVLWSTLTDNRGEAELWISPFREEAGTDGLSLLVDGTRLPEPPKVTPWNVQQAEADVNFCQLYTLQAPPAQKKADIAFIVDATGSMGDEIEFLKKDLESILSRVKQRQGDIELRTGTVFYRDEGDDYVTRFSPFTNDYAQTMAFIARQSAGGGGDLPEAVHTALEAGLQSLDWNTSARSRIAFLILDAPAHQDHQGVVESLQKSVQAYAGMGVKLIPVYCSGPSKDCEFMCRFFAILTGGTYVFLTDDSGVGESHVEPSVGEFQPELLNDLLMRLIAKYIE